MVVHHQDSWEEETLEIGVEVEQRDREVEAQEGRRHRGGTTATCRRQIEAVECKTYG